ncbi:SDR family oxidoreductase [Haloarculaceae archaeon H-GB11]|nr:SDR family oxidoreductase [Haloarculaceae archaeon H-GB11]
MFREDAFADEVVLITGATGGIGRATARLMDRCGADVAITGRNAEKLSELDSELDGQVYAYRADLTNEEAREEFITGAREMLGNPTALVNSMGVGSGGTSVADLDQDTIDKLMEVNYTATALLTRDVYRGMREREAGAIVFVSSLSGLRGSKHYAPYDASKFAITGFAQSLAREAIEHNVRVNSVCPGWVDTPMATEMLREVAATEGERPRPSFERHESRYRRGGSRHRKKSPTRRHSCFPTQRPT